MVLQQTLTKGQISQLSREELEQQVFGHLQPFLLPRLIFTDTPVFVNDEEQTSRTCFMFSSIHLHCLPLPLNCLAFYIKAESAGAETSLTLRMTDENTMCSRPKFFVNRPL